MEDFKHTINAWVYVNSEQSSHGGPVSGKDIVDIIQKSLTGHMAKGIERKATITYIDIKPCNLGKVL